MTHCCPSTSPSDEQSMAMGQDSATVITLGAGVRVLGSSSSSEADCSVTVRTLYPLLLTPEFPPGEQGREYHCRSGREAFQALLCRHLGSAGPVPHRGLSSDLVVNPPDAGSNSQPVVTTRKPPNRSFYIKGG